jgi:hypothetical protein
MPSDFVTGRSMLDANNKPEFREKLSLSSIPLRPN